MSGTVFCMQKKRKTVWYFYDNICYQLKKRFTLLSFLCIINWKGVVRMIGKRIKYLRDERHLSQEKLAAALGVSRMTVNNYENEKRAPDIDFARHIADYFGVTVEFLMGRTEYRYKRDEKVSLARAEKLFRTMERLPQPEIQELVSSLIETLEKSVEADMADDIVHALNHCCVQVRRLLYGYEGLQSDISVPVKELRNFNVPEDKIRLAVQYKPRIIYDTAYQTANRMNEEVNSCARSMEKNLEKLVEAKLQEKADT